MKRFAQILILIVIIIFIVPVFLSDSISASAEKVVNVPAGIVYEEFNNLKEFSEWEPWTKNDSLASQEFFSPYRGNGAGYKWTTTDQTNAEITITKTISDQSIDYKLEDLGLGKDSKMRVEFTQIPGNKTKVKWSITSHKIGYFSRYYSYFTSKNLTEKLEQGLNNLSERLNTAALTPEQAQSLKPDMIKTEIFQGEKLLTVLNETSLEQKEIETATQESLGLIYSYLTDYLKVAPQKIGNPVSYYEFIDLASKKAKFYSGYPMTESVKLEDGMQLQSIPAATALVSIHKGKYQNISTTMDKMKNYAKKHNLKIGNSFWEEYLNDPEAVKSQEELLTKIYIPIVE